MGTKVPGNESSQERKFQGTKVPSNESSRERKFPGTKVPPMELSFLGTKVPWYESSSYRWTERHIYTGATASLQTFHSVFQV